MGVCCSHTHICVPKVSGEGGGGGLGLLWRIFRPSVDSCPVVYRAFQCSTFLLFVSNFSFTFFFFLFGRVMGLISFHVEIIIIYFRVRHRLPSFEKSGLLLFGSHYIHRTHATCFTSCNLPTCIAVSVISCNPLHFSYFSAWTMQWLQSLWFNVSDRWSS